MTKHRILLLALGLSIICGSRFSYAILPTPFTPEPIIALLFILLVPKPTQFLRLFLSKFFSYWPYLIALLLALVFGLVNSHETYDIIRDFRIILDFFLFSSGIFALFETVSFIQLKCLFVSAFCVSSLFLGFLSLQLFPNLTALQTQNSIRTILPSVLTLPLGLCNFIYKKNSPLLRLVIYILLALTCFLIYFQGLFRQSLFPLVGLSAIALCDLWYSLKRKYIIYLFLCIAIFFSILWTGNYLSLFSPDLASLVSRFRLFSGFGGGVWNEQQFVAFMIERMQNTADNLDVETQRYALFATLLDNFDLYTLLPLGLGRDGVRERVVVLFSNYSIFGTEDSLLFYLAIHFGILTSTFVLAITASKVVRFLVGIPIAMRFMCASIIGSLLLYFNATADLAYTLVQSLAYSIAMISLSLTDGRSYSRNSKT